ncbi:MAG: YtxH domain-containing protein [bacterium]
MGKFKKGLVLGGAVGAFLMWLNATPKGKELRAKLLEHSDALFAEIKESVKQLEGPTKEMYDALVERAVAEYASKKDMAVDMKNKLIKELKKRWESVEEEINE